MRLPVVSHRPRRSLGRLVILGDVGFRDLLSDPLVPVVLACLGLGAAYLSEVEILTWVVFGGIAGYSLSGSV